MTLESIMKSQFDQLNICYRFNKYEDFKYLVCGVYENDTLVKIMDSNNPISCLGHIGDLISQFKFDACECPGFMDDLFLDCEKDCIKGVVYTFRTHAEKTNLVVEYMNMVSDNWDLEIEIVTNNNDISFYIPIEKFIATKWKVQGMMQIVRCLNNSYKFEKLKNNTFNLLTADYNKDKFSKLYTISHMKINDDLSFMENNNFVYEMHGLAAHSQEIGIISLINKIYSNVISQN